MAHVHPTAIVDPKAELAPDVEVGPYAIVGAGVQVGAGSRLHAHAVVLGPCVLGESSSVGSFAVIGGESQNKRAPGAGSSGLFVGKRNRFREHVTIHRGTDSGATRIGTDNLFMVGSHVAHDARVGSSCTFANGVQLAGHTTIEDHVTFGGLSGVAQFVTVGQSAFIAAGAMCERRVPPFVIVQGDRARVRALNVVGLRRRGVPAATIAHLESAFRALFCGRTTRKAAVATVPRGDPFVDALLDAIAATG